jgi:hypothetical protein
MNPQGAVFLSYASQDAEAAKRICESLRASGIEVWFDQSDLVGGDAWDQKIRRQIKECALLIPIIIACGNFTSVSTKMTHRTNIGKQPQQCTSNRATAH